MVDFPFLFERTVMVSLSVTISVFLNAEAQFSFKKISHSCALSVL